MFEVGDRVIRQIDIGINIVMHGVIVEKYETSRGLERMEASIQYLYAVKWDNIEEIQRGYFEFSLQKEE